MVPFHVNCLLYQCCFLFLFKKKTNTHTQKKTTKLFNLFIYFYKMKENTRMEEITECRQKCHYGAVTETSFS